METIRWKKKKLHIENNEELMQERPKKWQVCMGLRYPRGFGMQECFSSSDSWDEAYEKLKELYKLETGFDLEEQEHGKNVWVEALWEVPDMTKSAHPLEPNGYVFTITKREEGI